MGTNSSILLAFQPYFQLMRFFKNAHFKLKVGISANLGTMSQIMTFIVQYCITPASLCQTIWVGPPTVLESSFRLILGPIGALWITVVHPWICPFLCFCVAERLSLPCKHIALWFLIQRSRVQTRRAALLGKCLKTSSSGRPMPCEGNW